MIAIGATKAESPNINQRLKIFDPITFPTDKDQLPFNAAIPDKNNSGAEVHIARTVNPIRSAETLKYWAILTLVLMRWLAEYQSKNSQIIRNVTANIIQ